MHDRQRRISLLARHNLGLTRKSDFIHSLSAAFERKVDELALIDLETTDQLTELVRSAYKSAKLDIEPNSVRCFSQSEHQKVFDLVTCLGDKLNKAPIFLLFRQSELCGAGSAESSTALAKARSLIGVDGDELAIIAANREDGLLLDYSPEDVDNCYELAV